MHWTLIVDMEYDMGLGSMSAAVVRDKCPALMLSYTVLGIHIFACVWLAVCLKIWKYELQFWKNSKIFWCTSIECGRGDDGVSESPKSKPVEFYIQYNSMQPGSSKPRRIWRVAQLTWHSRNTDWPYATKKRTTHSSPDQNVCVCFRFYWFEFFVFIFFCVDIIQ